MQSLVGMTTEEIETVLTGMGEPAYRGKQVAAWVYRRGASNIAEMTYVSRSLRDKLGEQYHVAVPTVAHRDEASDGTVKYLLAMQDGQTIETVYLPYSDRV